MLRYGSARAKSLGKSVHFSQQNGEFMDFADNSIDLALTMIFLHELSTKAIRNIIREMHRVLRPGGMMINLEQPQYKGMALIEAYMRDWDTLNNNEPFWGTLHDMDLEALAVDAGFKRTSITQTMQPNVIAGEAMKADDPMKRDYSGRGMWFFYQAVK
jgi:ubiquinone/menaquinone biosynthesis C-methylase UbiE